MTESATLAAQIAPPPRRWKPAGGVQWLHAIGLATFVALFKIGADCWGWATVIGYGPRWPALAPAAVVTIGALARRRRPWLTLLATVGLGVWLLDVNVPLPRFGDGTVRLRVLTLNADGGNTAGRGTDPTRIGRLIADVRPDVIFLQEWEMPGPPPLPAGTWTVRRQRNTMIATRLPVEAVDGLTTDRLFRESQVFGCRLTVAPGRAVWAFSPHLQTPRAGFSRLLAGRRDALRLTADLARQRQAVSERAVAWIGETAGDADVLIGGDFNLVPDGRIFRTTWAARFADAFAASGWGPGGTKLQDGWRVRIDHVMTGSAWRATACRVGPDVGSDHLPLIADVELRG